MPKTPVIKLSSPATKEYWEVPVLFEDEHLLALDKPAKLLCTPDPDDLNRPSLMSLMHQAIADGKPWARERGLSYLMNAHQLDFETTGVWLLAKSKPVLVSLNNLFSADKPVKHYVALIHGFPELPAWEVNEPIGLHAAHIGLWRVDKKNGKRALTKFECIESFRGYTLIRCQPVTNRAHQIRVHLAFGRMPICGDTLYGGKSLWLSRLKPNFRLKPDAEERPLISSVGLHAEKLELTHPVTGVPVSITAPRPKILEVALKMLRKYAGYGPLPPDQD
jgi:RluA family pseudouridine synthase